jgi:putative tricarboxylic transport membrane protein
LISRDGYWIFLDRPVSATLVVINALLLLAMIYLTIKRVRGVKKSELSKAMASDE